MNNVLSLKGSLIYWLQKILLFVAIITNLSINLYLTFFTGVVLRLTAGEMLGLA